MNMSERFYRGLDKIAGRSGTAGLAATVEEVRGVFEGSMGRVPETLVRSVYLRFLDGFNKSGKPEAEFVPSAYDLGAYVDLFWMEYDENFRKLADEDWTFLRDELSSCAGSMDMDILTYVMTQIVDRGKI